MPVVMTKDQRRHLAILRIKRQMPDDYAQLLMRFNIHSAINGRPNRRDMDESNALVIFKGWNERPGHRQFELLILLITDHPTNVEVRDRIRCRIARNILHRRRERPL